MPVARSARDGSSLKTHSTAVSVGGAYVVPSCLSMSTGGSGSCPFQRPLPAVIDVLTKNQFAGGSDVDLFAHLWEGRRLGVLLPVESTRFGDLRFSHDHPRSVDRRVRIDGRFLNDMRDQMLYQRLAPGVVAMAGVAAHRRSARTPFACISRTHAKRRALPTEAFDIIQLSPAVGCNSLQKRSSSFSKARTSVFTEKRERRC